MIITDLSYEPTTEDIQAYNENQAAANAVQEFETSWYIPERPYSPLDALNRKAAALGSPGYTRAASNANYNGHPVSVHWNDYRGYYIAEYYYGERVVLARGSFSECLSAAIREYRRGHLGSSVSVGIKNDDCEALAVCRSSSDLIPGKPNNSDRSWYTWRHKCAAASARDSANPCGLRMNFDWDLLQTAETEEAYEKALTEKFGRAWTF